MDIYNGQDLMGGFLYWLKEKIITGQRSGYRVSRKGFKTFPFVPSKMSKPVIFSLEIWNDTLVINSKKR